MPSQSQAGVDRTALKVNQAGIVSTLLLAFLASAIFPPAVWLVPALAAVMLVGTFAPQAAVFKLAYARVLRPRGILKPRPVQESPRPHNFAQLLGGTVLALASVAFLAVAPSIGWGLVWIVLLLAAVNLFFGF
jgi:hypothetical protein